MNGELCIDKEEEEAPAVPLHVELCFIVWLLVVRVYIGDYNKFAIYVEPWGDHLTLAQKTEAEDEDERGIARDRVTFDWFLTTKTTK